LGDAWHACGQVVGDAALAAALRSRPLVVTLLAGDGPGAPARPPRALGSTEFDLAQLLHPRWARLGPGFAARGTGVSWRHATGHMHLLSIASSSAAAAPWAAQLALPLPFQLTRQV